MSEPQSSDLDISIIQDPPNGYTSSDKKNIYFLGIIDFLTEFQVRKKIEYHIKTTFQSKDVSCIPPKPYGKRFMNFIQKIVEVKVKPKQSRKRKKTGQREEQIILS